MNAQALSAAPARPVQAPLARGRRQPKSTEESPRWQWLLLLAVPVLEYLRPIDGYLHVLAPLRISGIMVFAMLVVFLRTRKNYLREENLHKLLIAFWAVISITIVFAPNTRATFNTSLGMFWLAVGFVFPVSVILCSKERVFKFFFFWLAVQTGLAIIVALNHGHGLGSYVLDENDVAMVIDMSIPYAVYLALFPGLSRIKRILVYSSIPFMLLALGVADSRGGLLGLAAVLLMLPLLSRKPVRNTLALVAAVLLAIAILLRYLSAAYVTDVEGIDDPNDSTRDERLWSWSIGWVMYKENPVLGVGAGNYAWTNHLYATKSPMYRPGRKILGGRAAHSVYFTLLPELGTVGAIIFICILVAILNRYRSVRRYCRAQAPLSDDALRFELLFKAMLCSCAGFMIAGAFISVLYYPPFWHLVGLVAATYRTAGRELPGFAQPAVPRGRFKRLRADT